MRKNTDCTAKPQDIVDRAKRDRTNNSLEERVTKVQKKTAFPIGELRIKFSDGTPISNPPFDTVTEASTVTIESTRIRTFPAAKVLLSQ